jgi:hypothetical protein
MDRLIVLALLLSLVVPLGPAEAQQAERVFRVGVLNFGSSTPNPLTYPLNSSMAQRLADLGFREGQNLVLERRWADANFERWHCFPAMRTRWWRAMPSRTATSPA